MYVLLAEGFEEVEAFTPVDYLKRAGIEVCLISVGRERAVTGSHGIVVFTDMMAKLTPIVPDWDGLILPGGMPGSRNLADSIEVNSLLRKAEKNSLLICAICAAPALVLGRKGLLDERAWTCYPGMEDEAGSPAIENWKEERVVVDGNIITSRAAGTAGEWSLKIIEKLEGAEAAAKVAKSVLLS
jgi:4-methyl-5(b-hydroxyethyl)-thiazole monophosphate biosynthesis